MKTPSVHFRRVGRRLGKSLALGAAVALVLAGCSSPGETPEGNGGGAPATGGSLVVANHVDQAGFDPAAANKNFSREPYTRELLDAMLVDKQPLTPLLGTSEGRAQ